MPWRRKRYNYARAAFPDTARDGRRGGGGRRRRGLSTSAARSRPPVTLRTAGARVFRTVAADAFPDAVGRREGRGNETIFVHVAAETPRARPWTTSRRFRATVLRFFL